MPRRATGPIPRRARTAAGFTLIEMMVVLAVMGLLLLLVLTRGPPHSASLTLRTAAAELAAGLRAARGRAIAGGRTVAFTPGALPPGVSLAVSAQPPGPILFQPDGSASDGTLRLGLGGLVDEVRVNWLTGAIDVGDVAHAPD